MKILAVETATEACSAALLLDGAVRERFRIAPREHTHLILPMIESLLNEAGIGLGTLDALAFGRGPGSFTGVRIAAGIIQGLALGCDLQVVPVSSLASMAQHFFESNDFGTAISAFDARMGEVYLGVYRKGPEGLVRPVGEEAVLPADRADFSAIGPEGCAGLGSGWETYAEALGKGLNGRLRSIVPECYPHAAAVALLAQEAFRNGLAVAPENALPVYLRDKVARKKGE